MIQIRWIWDEWAGLEIKRSTQTHSFESPRRPDPLPDDKEDADDDSKKDGSEVAEPKFYKAALEKTRDSQENCYGINPSYNLGPP